MNILALILCAAIGYLLGSFSTGITLSAMDGVDIRTKGSKNTGASNMLRVMGTKKGLMTFIGDCGKAALSIMLGWFIAGQNGQLVASLFVIIGHNWPIYYHFKGGKGIACSTAVLALIFPWQGITAILLCILVIAVTKYISLGSMVMLVSFSVLILCTQPFWPVGVWSILLMIFAVYRHRSNIDRLLKGTENRLSFKKKQKSA